jgi:tetratricopeptide (TPR) repeat protein
MSWLIEWLGLVWLTAVPAAEPVTSAVRPVTPQVGISQAALDRAACESAFGLAATSACTRAIAAGGVADRELARLHIRRGSELRSIGNLDAAIIDYTAAIERDPADPSAFCQRADAWRDKGAFDLAIADYSEAIRLDPLLASALVHRGLLYERKRQLDRARADFAAALALPPKYAHSYGAQGTARERLAMWWSIAPRAADPEQH